MFLFVLSFSFTLQASVDFLTTFGVSLHCRSDKVIERMTPSETMIRKLLNYTGVGINSNDYYHLDLFCFALFRDLVRQISRVLS